MVIYDKTLSPFSIILNLSHSLANWFQNGILKSTTK